MAERPTRKQLARFMCVRVHGPGFTPQQVESAEALFKMSPRLEELARARHAEFQQAVNLRAAGQDGD
jgi:hypothetical protein